jgi:mono/diheme cytochrome c family protein
MTTNRLPILLSLDWYITSMRSLFRRGGLLTAFAFIAVSCRQFPETRPTTDLIAQGRDIFRDETFGDEKFWTDTARLHEVVEEDIQPLEALSLGLKVDQDRLNLVKFLIHNPFSTGGTKELLRQNAVVGVRAQFDDRGNISRIGITCALCHSTVDNALLPGIGHRMDGSPNTDLKVGRILAMLKNFSEPQKALFRGWPAGFYDPRINFDGKNTPLVLPPAHGLAQVKNETYTGDDTISYWNAYVAVTQMHGQGVFIDDRLGIRIAQTPDLVTPKLAALRAYQHSLPVPPTPGASYDRGAANRGAAVFQANCASCHVGVRLTDNNAGILHAPSETGMDSAYAARTINKKYRTTPLRALWQHAPYFHDGSARTLRDVVEHYDRVRNLRLTNRQKKDLVEYLKSL